MPNVPSSRLRRLNDAAVNPDGAYVLYWMIAHRRAAYNYSLDHAVAQARALKRPLIVLEPVRLDYPWASVRTHTFVLQGMADNARDFAAAKVTYYPYVEPAHGAGKGLLVALAQNACLVVTDDSPAFFLPHMLRRAAERLDVALDAVDSYGLLPLRTADKAYPNAHAFRRLLQKRLPDIVDQCPAAKLPRDAQLQGGVVPDSVQRRWPAATGALLAATPEALAKLPLDQAVGPSTVVGGRRAGLRRLATFFAEGLGRYVTDRNHPDLPAQSGLSPYLHFGNVSTHELFAKLRAREDWQPTRLSARAMGQREGFWGMSPEAESFMDELVTWRELSANMAALRPDDYTRYESLPDWAKATLAEHRGDPRPHTYSLDQLAAGQTDDPLWNAAQRELREEGTLHNYLRMLWGKRVLAWCRTPEQALTTLIELNNRYAIDGRDPNSYAGIFWALGRYDRPWPSHPIFGKVRLMTSASTLRKLKLKAYLQRYGEPAKAAAPAAAPQRTAAKAPPRPRRSPP